MDYCKGDIVYVRPDLTDIDQNQDDYCIITPMWKYAGEKATIAKVVSRSKGAYRLDIDACAFYWMNYMLLSEEEYKILYGPEVEAEDLMSLLC